ncbi:MAG: substrate-binding domain-containing protein [Pseudomonadota bacterium]
MNHSASTVTAFGKSLLAGAACLALVACGGEPEDVAQPLTIIGSSTVYPFAQKVAEDMVAANEGMAAPALESTGSSEGIGEFCKGDGPDTADIVNASRRMTLAEFETCKAGGVTDIIEIKVGRDGIVFASSQDKGLDLALTSAAVYRALSASPFGEEQTATNWSDVAGSLPNEPIIVYGPSDTSGTRDALLEVVMMPACTANGAMAALEESDPDAFEQNCHTLRSDSAYIEQGEKDDLIVGKIANNPRAVGIFGYSYLEENSEAIKGLTLDGVAPTADTIADGSYPGSRPLYMYVKKARIGVTPGLEEYLAQWAKSWSAGSALTQIGLVPATEEIQAKSAEAISAKVTLTAADFE